MGQDIRNTQTGTALIKTAAGGIDSIVDELRNLKELALNAANDHNTDADRAIIQKEFDNRKANIDDIASSTNYNGKILLDGRYSRKTIDVTTLTTDTITQKVPGDEPEKIAVITDILSPTNPENLGPTNAVVHSGAVEPGGYEDVISGDYTITRDGVYTIASGTNGANINITSGIHNVKFVSQNAGDVAQNIHITGPADGNANVWIENLKIRNSDSANIIEFQGTNNTLNIKGNNYFDITRQGYHNTVIHVGDGLTVEGGSNGTGTLTFDHAYIGALIGTDANEESNASLTINSGTYKAIAKNFSTTNHRGRLGAFIGSGCFASIGDITVNGGTFIDGSQDDLVIGCGSGGKCGNITIKNATVTASYKIGDAAIGASTASSTVNSICGDIYVGNSNVYCRGWSGSAIGTGGEEQSGSHPGARIAGNITVENTILNIESDRGAGIGTGSYGQAGNITVNNCDLTNVISKRGEYIGRGVQGVVGTVTVNGDEIDLDSEGNQPGGDGKVISYITVSPADEEKEISTTVTTVETTTKKVYNPLVIHTGPKANQNFNVYINDMRAKALKGKIPNEDDIEHMAHLSADKAKEYQEMLDKAKDMSIDDVSVTNKENANLAIRVIDGALDYALDEATTVGAYIYRLNITEDNLTTAEENSVSSESVIRDADMAKEMTEFTKHNVIMQASQAMLSQANKNASSVLNLLQ